jgi:hypothetical protein
MWWYLPTTAGSPAIQEDSGAKTTKSIPQEITNLLRPPESMQDYTNTANGSEARG